MKGKLGDLFNVGDYKKLFEFLKFYGDKKKLTIKAKIKYLHRFDF